MWCWFRRQASHFPVVHFDYRDSRTLAALINTKNSGTPKRQSPDRETVNVNQANTCVQ